MGPFRKEKWTHFKNKQREFIKENSQLENELVTTGEMRSTSVGEERANLSAVDYLL